MMDSRVSIPAAERVTIEVHAPDDVATAGLAEDARHGLSAEFKQLPPKYFYDDRGSRLFERITELPEYYPTRTERWILGRYADEIVAEADAAELFELGSGTASKTLVLLDAMSRAETLRRYVPVDICEEITREVAAKLAADYPEMTVHGVVCDFERHLELLPPGERRLIAFLGGTIGNFDGEARSAFLSRIAGLMGPDDRLLLGTDLVKDRQRLELAYDDRAGVTAEFNKNLLHVLNRELDANFDPDGFEHVAFYDSERSRIDIRLRSLADQRITVDALGMEVHFDRGEEMRTEISCKFTRRSIERAFEAAGLRLLGWFTDPDDQFALSLAAPAE